MKLTNPFVGLLSASLLAPSLVQAQNSCWTCDSGCVKCASVGAVQAANNDVSFAHKIVNIDARDCKGGESISWACCVESNAPAWTAPAECKYTDCDGGGQDGDKNKCEDVFDVSFAVPVDAQSVVINTHDGRTGGATDLAVKDVCAGQENQGGCNGQDPPSTGHCLLTIDLSTCDVIAPLACPDGAASECAARNVDVCTNFVYDDDTCECVADHPGGEIECAAEDIFACTGSATCNGEGACGEIPELGSETVCREAAGDCDMEERCTGVAGAGCPADAFKPSTHVCRSSEGVCDVEETCDGSTAACPADAFMPSTHVCRQSEGVCDVEETCDGSTAACPADSFMPSTHVCRASEGVCDVEEMCDGSTAACPVDEFKAPTHVCRSSEGVCDVEETCDGSTAACPEDAFMPSTHVCRASEGVCDVEETCDGSTAACPVDEFKPPTHVCRASEGICDVEETCDGSTAACPADAFMPSSHVCRASEGVCDVEETCDGSTAACPEDAFMPSTHVCRTSEGVCDVEETCDGSTAACPVDEFKPPTHVCRASEGVCDVEEMCDGSTAACPTDAFKPSTHVCRESEGLCDVEETCDGSTAACPADVLRPSTHVCRPKENMCDEEETCDGQNAACPCDAGREHGYTYKCGNTQFLCGVKESELTTGNGGQHEFGDVTIGKGKEIEELTFPGCLDIQIPTQCPNRRGLSNFATGICSGDSWTDVSKVEPDDSTVIPDPIGSPACWHNTETETRRSIRNLRG